MVSLCRVIVILLFLGLGVFQGISEQTVSAQPIPFDGDIRITRYPGNSTCFKIETADGMTIVTDPYNMDEDVQADIVTESHQHGDHTDVSRITGNYTLITTPGQFHVKGIAIIGVPGQHNKGDPGVTNIIYVFNLNGLRLAEFASQGQTPTEEMFTRIGDVDILILQLFNGSGKLSPEEGREIVKRSHASMILSAHGDPNLNPELARLIGGTNRTHHGVLVVNKSELRNQPIPQVIEIISK